MSKVIRELKLAMPVAKELYNSDKDFLLIHQ